MSVIIQPSKDLNGNPQPMVYDSDNHKVIVDSNGYIVTGGNRIVNRPSKASYISTPQTNTSGIEEAWGYAISNGIGRIKVKAGVYYLNGSANISDASNIIFEGSGNSILKYPDGVTTFRMLDFGSGTATNITIKNIVFDGNEANVTQPSDGNDGILTYFGSLTTGTNIKLKGCTWQNIGATGVKIVQTTGIRLIDCLFNNATGVNAFYGAESSNVFMTGNQFLEMNMPNQSSCINFDSFSHYSITSNYFEMTLGGGIYGVYPASDYGSGSNHGVISHNIFNISSTTTNTGINTGDGESLADGVNGLIIDSNVFFMGASGNTDNAINLNGTSAGQSQNIMITHNIFFGTSGYGVAINTAGSGISKGITVIGNYGYSLSGFWNGMSDTAVPIIVKDNIVEDSYNFTTADYAPPTGAVIEGNVGTFSTNGKPYNPAGFTITSPSVPASGTAIVNPFPFPVRIYITGAGDVTAYAITDPGNVTNSFSTSLSVGKEITLGFAASITLTYSTAPTWAWYGE